MKDFPAALDGLQWWYHNHCDGVWEKNHSVLIESLDDRRWSVRIPIKDTELEHRKFSEVYIKGDCSRDCECWVDDGEFRGTEGMLALESIIQVFLSWVGYAGPDTKADNR